MYCKLSIVEKHLACILYCLILSMRVLYKKNTPKGGGYLFSPMLDVLSVGRATNLLSKCHDLYLCAGFKNWGYIWTYGVEIKHDWNQYLLREEIGDQKWHEQTDQTIWIYNFQPFFSEIGCGLAVISVEPACPSRSTPKIRAIQRFLCSRMEVSKDSLDDRVKLWWIVVWCIWQPQFVGHCNYLFFVQGCPMICPKISKDSSINIRLAFLPRHWTKPANDGNGCVPWGLSYSNSPSTPLGKKHPITITLQVSPKWTPRAPDHHHHHTSSSSHFIIIIIIITLHHHHTSSSSYFIIIIIIITITLHHHHHHHHHHTSSSSSS